MGENHHMKYLILLIFLSLTPFQYGQFVLADMINTTNSIENEITPSSVRSTQIESIDLHMENIQESSFNMNFP